jgi:predicted RNase H-like nuclease (RuvC/YqgF family)
MRFRRLERRFSITAQRLSVRPHIPWYIRWAIAIPLLLILGGVVWWAYDSGLELAGFHRGQAVKELEDLRENVTMLQEENARLSSQAASFERQAQMEHAANQEIANQIKSLSDENVRLKENVSFFQNLPLAQADTESDLSILRLKIERDSLPGEYFCRMILVQSVKQRGKAFQGNMQLIVNAIQDGKKVVLQFPSGSAEQEVAAYQLNFKYYQVIDKTFKVAPGITIENVQVRVFERGFREPKVVQSVGLS